MTIRDSHDTCVTCGRGLYYFERAYGPTACRPCAARTGVARLCDRNFFVRMAQRAAQTEPWWRWTVYLDHALAWWEIDRDRLASKGESRIVSRDESTGVCVVESTKMAYVAAEDVGLEDVGLENLTTETSMGDGIRRLTFCDVSAE